ncbi:hypothetical protein, partial [Lactococcus formosensis]|uniref:hypothetical protein n=1 Tax=Lactococcus formosensis TaxID=1281486 RepID=UPI00254F2086
MASVGGIAVVSLNFILIIGAFIISSRGYVKKIEDFTLFFLLEGKFWIKNASVWLMLYIDYDI